MKSTSYAASGVDVKKSDQMKREINDLIFQTSNRFSLPIKGHYAGVFQVGKQKLTIHCDGVGSKVLVAEQLKKFDTIGIDAAAMNLNDLLCIGSQPIVAVDYLALREENQPLVREIMKGLVAGCREADCALIGGETAILPDMIQGTGNSFDLAVTCVGLLEKEIKGDALQTGDTLIGLYASGLHSNGYTLARKALSLEKWGKEMLIPTRIYVKPVLEILSACNVHGIAHITGGAFSKLKRIGAYSRRGFLLNQLPPLPPIFAALQEKVKSDYELYRTFNCGIGMVLALPHSEAEAALSIARKHKCPGQIIGEVTGKEDVILEKEGKRISLL